MNRRQELILIGLDKLFQISMRMGDLIVLVWLLQALIGFEWDPTYWFAGVNTWYGCFGFWMLAWLIHIFETHYKRKYEK